MAATQQIVYTTSNTDTNLTSTTTWYGMTFLTSGAFDCSFVKLYLYRASTGAEGTWTFRLYATSAGLPTGSALATKTYSSRDFNTSPAQWYTITWDSPVSLSAATTYAIVVQYATGGETIYYALDTSKGYADGGVVRTTNSGSSWTDQSAFFDAPFEIWGEAGSSYVELSSSTTITIGCSSILDAILGLFGTSAITLDSTANLIGDLGLTGTSAIVLSSTSLLGYGPLSGAKAEKYSRKLVMIGNDSVYFQD